MFVEVDGRSSGEVWWDTPDQDMGWRWKFWALFGFPYDPAERTVAPVFSRDLFFLLVTLGTELLITGKLNMENFLQKFLQNSQF